MSSKVIAVDFDGTLVSHEYPEIGPEKPVVVEALRREKENGAHIILWTFRYGKELEAAVNWMEEKGIAPDSVNDNAPWLRHYPSRKIFYHEIWDDRARVIPGVNC